MVFQTVSTKGAPCMVSMTSRANPRGRGTSTAFIQQFSFPTGVFRLRVLTELTAVAEPWRSPQHLAGLVQVSPPQPPPPGPHACAELSWAQRLCLSLHLSSPAKSPPGYCLPSTCHYCLRQEALRSKTVTLRPPNGSRERMCVESGHPSSSLLARISA